MRLVGAVIVAGSFALTGHAASAAPRWLAAPALGVHTLCGALLAGLARPAALVPASRARRGAPGAASVLGRGHGCRRSARGRGLLPRLASARRQARAALGERLRPPPHRQAGAGRWPARARGGEPLRSHPAGCAGRPGRPATPRPNARRRHRPGPRRARGDRELPARPATASHRDDRERHGSRRRDHRCGGTGRSGDVDPRPWAAGREPPRGVGDRHDWRSGRGEGGDGSDGPARSRDRARPLPGGHASVRRLRRRGRSWCRAPAVGGYGSTCWWTTSPS